MTAKEQLLQELNFIPDNLIVETLNFVRFLKTKERFSEGDVPQTSLAAAAELMRDFYLEGNELTELSDQSNEDFYEYEKYA
jgi:hypothetical protein